jgi:hypothetical protein
MEESPSRSGLFLAGRLGKSNLAHHRHGANLLGLLHGEFRNVPKLPEAIHKLEN